MDLLWYYPDDEIPDISDLLYYDGEEEETLYYDKVKIPRKSPFMADYLQEHPDLTIEDIQEDIETFRRLGDEFDIDVMICSLREEVELFQQETMPVNLYWDNGEPIEPNSKWETLFYVCDWGFWQGCPCDLPEGNIPKEQWVKVRGHDWDNSQMIIKE